MITENLSTLKIHKLSQAQYDRAVENGSIDENALYLTPDEANKSILKNWSEVDTLVENGCYCFSGGIDVGDEKTYNNAYMRVDAYNHTNATQVLYLISSQRYILFRHLRGGTWESEWSWVNPPLVINSGEEVGVEYKTTELWNDKSVYTRRIRFVAEHGKTIYSVVDSGSIIIRQFAANSAGALPYIDATGLVRSNIMIASNGSLEYYDIRSNITSNVWTQIWYTKD